MKTKEFTREDGSKGSLYSLEKDDRVVSRFDKVGLSERAVVVKNKPTIIKNFFLGVTTSDGKDITIQITGGQKKNLDKAGDLKGKTIVAYEYKNDYGNQVGCKVL